MSRRPVKGTAIVVAIVLASLVVPALVLAGLFLLLVSGLSEHIVPLRIEAPVERRSLASPCAFMRCTRSDELWAPS
jgi:hypothetical protein